MGEMKKMNRNHYMALGTVLLLIGIAIFKLEAVTLTENTTRFVAQQMGTIPEDGLFQAVTPKKIIAIPSWFRFSCISVGAILMLHAIGMSKPGG